MLRFWWSRLRRRCGDGAAAIDEAIIGAAPWRWRTGRLNRRDDEMDDGSSSGEVDEGRQAVAVDDGVGVAAPARWSMGWWTEKAGRSGEVVVAPTVYEWGNGGGGGISNCGTRLSEMWESYELIPRLKFRTSRRLGIGR